MPAQLPFPSRSPAAQFEWLSLSCLHNNRYLAIQGHNRLPMLSKLLRALFSLLLSKNRSRPAGRFVGHTWREAHGGWIGLLTGTRLRSSALIDVYQDFFSSQPVRFIPVPGKQPSCMTAP